MNNNEIKGLCISLMKADTEDEVIAILKRAGYWEDPKYWRLYGDDPSNYNAAGNQADISTAALVEKITNSRDAILMNQCYVNGIDPKGTGAPSSVRLAVAQFFDDNPIGELAGHIKEWTPAKRRLVAQNLAVFLTGKKPSDGYPSVSIADKGEGQTPLRIGETILSLGRKNKKEIPFVHGKWNMGGTAALLYAGMRNFQLVVSRRNPKIVDIQGKKHSSDENWGFTIVRREDPIGINDTSVYKYLAPLNASLRPQEGDILNFAEEKFPIFPNFETPYAENVEWGTLIKLYEYQIKNKQMIGGSGDSILRPLDLLAPDLGLPFRLHECRYGGPSGSRVHQVNGLLTRLFVDKGDVLENGFPTYHNPEINGERISLAVYAFKDGKAKLYRDPSKTIIFSLNGQGQGWLPDSFFTRKRVGLGFLKNSLLVIVDCSSLTDRAQEILFVNDRVHIRQEGPFWEKIEEELIDYLGNHKGLSELQEERQRQMVEDKLDDSKPLEQVLGSMFKNSSALSKIFLKGERLSNAFRTQMVKGTTKDFEGKPFPTFFRFLKLDYGATLKREAWINTRCRISFDTDAQNDYFNRKANSGTYDLLFQSTQEWVNAKSFGFDYGVNLLNGIATLNVYIPQNIQIKSILKFKLVVTDPLRIIEPPFENEFHLTTAEKPELKTKGNNTRRNPRSNNKGDDRNDNMGIQFPKIIKVYEADWEKHQFNKFSGLSIISKKTATSETDYTFFINMDNVYLKHEVKSDLQDEKFIKAQFEYGMALLGISVIYDDQQNQMDDRKESIEDKALFFSRAMAPFIIPMIRELGGNMNLKTELVQELTTS